MRDIVIRDIRLFDCEDHKKAEDARREAGRNTHLRPGSTLIAAMGSHWQQGSFEAVQAMAEETWKAGYEIRLYEEHDRCFNPYDALGIMRNMAYMRALREGWEYILYVDNDVLPAKDVLVKLLQHPIPILTPIITYADGHDYGLGMPHMPRGKGLAMVSSSVLSFILFQTTVFLPWALGGFWQDAIGADEDYHFAKLKQSGHALFVDTNVVVSCANGPSYPLDKVIDRTPESLKPRP